MNVIKSIDFPDKTFSSKEELFKSLKENEARLIEIKKSQPHFSCQKNSTIMFGDSLLKDKNGNTSKALGNVQTSSDKIYPIISTTRWMDSHRDVHFDKCFNRTVKDQQGKVCYALDHVVTFNTVIAWKENVKMFVSQIPWRTVGKDIEGTTEGLIFEIDKSKVRLPDVLKAIEGKESDFENSISMIYYTIKLAINSDAPEYKENKAYHDSRYNEIANKEEVDEIGYFWGVEELGIRGEGSLVVAGGSNSATSIYTEENKNEDPSKDTLNNTDSSNGTPKKSNKKLLL